MNSLHKMAQMDATRIYIVASVVIWWSKCGIISAKAGIKCYCTTLECETTGENMCTSTLGKCFSQLALNSGVSDIHGCTEQLNTHMRTSCLQNGQGDIISTKKDSAFALMCCTGNLCNYLDSKDRPMSLDIVNGDVDANNHSNGQDHYQKGSNNRFPNNTPGDNQSGDVFYSSQELWFKAAMIAVPIAGGFILILLVFLAIRMLRHDNRRQRELKHNQSLAKAQLYVTDHFYNPSNKLLSSCSNSAGVGMAGMFADEEYNNMYNHKTTSMGEGGFVTTPQEYVYVSDQFLDYQHLQQKHHHNLQHHQHQPNYLLLQQQQESVQNQQPHLIGMLVRDNSSHNNFYHSIGNNNIGNNNIENNINNGSNNICNNGIGNSNISSFNSNSVVHNKENSSCKGNDSLPNANNSQNSISSNTYIKNDDVCVKNNTKDSNTNNNPSKHNHHHGHNHHHHHQSSSNSSTSPTSKKNYAYEKLRESNGFENPCDSMIVWNVNENKSDVRTSPSVHDKDCA